MNVNEDSGVKKNERKVWNLGGTHHPQSKLQLEQSTIEPVYQVMIFAISFLIQLTRHCILPDLATSSMST